MSKGLKIGCVVLVVIALMVVMMVSWAFKIRNQMVGNDEDVKQKWAQVQNVYQRRFDLIPNLVETVKGYAKHERETLQSVIEARSKVGGVVNLDSKDLTPENLAKFQQAQNGLTGALQRLMVVVEQYPNLKANENFIRLQDELAGTENRIAVERMRFTESVQKYNRYIRMFPQFLLAGIFNFKEKAQFAAADQAQQAPKVQF
jgi:LemA protein